MKRKGLFSRKQIYRGPVAFRVPRCGACGILKLCNSPKMPVSGKGKKKILIVGEAPGANEDAQNRPFVGDAGQLLQSALRRVGIDMRDDCWITNSLICRPPKNRKPTDKEIAYCRPNVDKAIRELQPEIIIPLGEVAMKSVIKPLWKGSIGKATRWVGWKIPSQKLNTWICPNYHPSFIMRLQKSNRAEVSMLLFETWLREAIELEGKPWKSVPDYLSQVERVYDTDRAARISTAMIERGGQIAFDYETDRLKPDGGGEIVCCAVCWQGEKAIAFPWQGAAIKAMSRLLLSDLEKIAANQKFEQRWTMHEFGHGVRNWSWCTLLGNHWMDNRRDSGSLKFQAFVMLGQPDYDSYHDPYKQAPNSNAKNKMRQLPMDEVLDYCGMDALLTFKIAQMQMWTEPGRPYYRS